MSRSSVRCAILTDRKSDRVQEWAKNSEWCIHKEISSSPQIVLLMGARIIPKNQIWILIVVPGPDGQMTVRGMEAEGVSGSKADAVTPAPEPRLKKFPINKPVETK